MKVLTALLIAVTVVNSATLGYDASVMNGLNILPSYTNFFHLNTATTGLMTAGAWIGDVLACFIMQPITDRYGRKAGILSSAIVCFIGIILQAAAQNTGMFVVSRVIVGLGSQLSSSAAPALLGELLPAATRGRILGIFFSCFYVGSLLVSIINYGSQNINSTWSWRLPSLLQLIPSILALCLLPFVPESPRWLIAQGKFDHAREVLTITRGDSDPNDPRVAAEFDTIETTIATEKEMFPRNPWIEIISTPGNRKRLAILVSFGIMLEMFGNYVVSFYLTKILDQAGITNTKTQTQINVILNCWSFAVAIAGSFALDYIGRRKQTLWCIVGMIVCLYILGGLIKVYGESTNTSGIYGSIAVIFLFQGFYSFSITPMTSVYPTEVSQYKLRITGIAIFRFFDCGFGLMASFAMSYAMANLGWKFYIINASYDFLFLAAAYFLFVETNALTLEEITAKFEGTVTLEAHGSEPQDLNGSLSNSEEIKDTKN
ncbi:hypothetical protein TCE0_023r07237 [Talaromyces pinophilus]|uniref:Major facilitator superfamily (MFS) profile domain-containing protein n=1 Tax=Talaromyces pinophilus TaxID=128442 RepID=A0A0B8N4U8_TALPI|nr:hypothetical protein TCE0_023r07237 [Talaromyces pinophilus]